MEGFILKINKIKINSYGKIKNKEIKLNNNLNIIDIKYEKRSEIVIMEIEIKFPSKNEKYNLTNEILEKDYVVKLSYF